MLHKYCANITKKSNYNISDVAFISRPDMFIAHRNAAGNSES